MVDIAFLLLTFFMLTTVFSRPQAMEINLPDDSTDTIVKESKVLMLRGSADDKIYWNVGDMTPEVIAYDGLADLLAEQRQAIGEDLIAIVSINRDGTYNNIVDMLDDIKLAGIDKFSIAPFAAADSAAVLAAQAGPAPVPDAN